MEDDQPDLEAPLPFDLELEDQRLTMQKDLKFFLTEQCTILCHLWEAVGKPVDKGRLKVYADALGDVPLGLLELAVTRTLREAGGYNVVPTIGAVWEALQKELGNPRDLARAMQEWADAKFRNLNMLTR